ncbi:MAG TPA: PLD nuclease N-terminal domain-containing protein [Acidimicrobiales bacterium]|nr:PLD nuclease N-terminal domain-containing protein [Acidimicrobiales bacterium]
MPDIVAGVVGIGFLVLWIYSIYDVITTDDAIIRHLPKVVWLLIVIVLSDIGSILWLALGRPQIWTRQAHDPQRYGSHRLRASPVTALDDGSLDHLSPIVRHREEQTRLHMWEAQLKRREEELRRRELGEGSGS